MISSDISGVLCPIWSVEKTSIISVETCVGPGMNNFGDFPNLYLVNLYEYRTRVI